MRGRQLAHWVGPETLTAVRLGVCQAPHLGKVFRETDKIFCGRFLLPTRGDPASMKFIDRIGGAVGEWGNSVLRQ